MGKFLPFLPALVVLACGDSGATETTGSTQVTGASMSGAATPGSPTSSSEPPTSEGEVDVSSDGGGVAESSSEGGGAPCEAGEIVCVGDVAQTCDGAGGFSESTPCQLACEPGIGCVDCIPGSTRCDAQGKQVCADDGTTWVDDGVCDPLLGLACDEPSGSCVGACADLGTLSYIGCEYYPVTTQQYDIFFTPNPFAVAISNAAGTATMVTVTRGDELVAQTTVDPEEVQIMILPWVDELTKGQGPSRQVKQGAYRLRATHPVTVYQFNPLNADQSNDASLLLPVNTWTGNYMVAAWPHWADYNTPGFYAVTASRDNTTVHMKAPPGGTVVQKGGGVDAKGDGVALLNTGDVIQVMTGAGGDVTGSQITADKPVQVIAGQECAQVPVGVVACDHLEDTIFPIEVLSNEYLVVPPPQIPNSDLEKGMVVRIVATAPDTTLEFDPPQANVEDVLVDAGSFVEIPDTLGKFKVTANHKIVVAQFMIGQEGGYGTSDPSMLLAVPSAQFREDYLVYAQPAWKANFVDIIAPDGASVTVDGAPVGGFVKLGSTGFSLAHVKLANTGNGNHRLSGDLSFGIAVSGVMDYGSYWYPGGLDLSVIPPL